MDIDASPGFTAWLLGERRRLQGLSEAVLREGALRALASGNAAPRWTSRRGWWRPTR